MTKEINKRLGKIEGHLGPSEITGPHAETLRAVRAKDPGLARRLQVALAGARGDLEIAIRKLTTEDLEVLITFCDVSPEEIA